MINNIDINKIVVFNQSSFGKRGFKYFIGDKDSKTLDLYACLPKMSVYWTDFDEGKYVCFLIKDNELLEKFNET